MTFLTFIVGCRPIQIIPPSPIPLNPHRPPLPPPHPQHFFSSTLCACLKYLIQNSISLDYPIYLFSIDALQSFLTVQQEQCFFQFQLVY